MSRKFYFYHFEKKKTRKPRFLRNSTSITASENRCIIKCWRPHYADATPDMNPHQHSAALIFFFLKKYYACFLLNRVLWDMQIFWCLKVKLDDWNRGKKKIYWDRTIPMRIHIWGRIGIVRTPVFESASVFCVRSRNWIFHNREFFNLFFLEKY